MAHNMNVDLSRPKLIQEIKRMFLYGVCGSLGALTDLAIYTLLIHNGVHYQPAVIAASVVANLVSFFINRRVTFKIADNPKRRMIMFFAVAGVGVTVSMTVIWIMVDKMHVPPIQAKIISLFFLFATQYTLNRLITFRFKFNDNSTSS